MAKLFLLIGIVTGGLLMWLFLQLPTAEERQFIEIYQTHACGAYHRDGWRITKFECEKITPIP